MEPLIVEIAKSFEMLAPKTKNAEELIDQIRLTYPEADVSELRRAAIFSMTSPTIPPDVVTRIYDVAIRLKPPMSAAH